MNSLKQLTAALLLAAIPCVSAHAAIALGDTIVIDFTKPGQETPGNWNNILDTDWDSDAGLGDADSTLSTSLISFLTGTPTGVGLLWDNVNESSPDDSSVSSIAGLDVNGVDNPAAFSVSGAIPRSAQIDTTFHVSEINQFIFTGLDDSLTYTIEFQSWTANTGRDANDWVIQPGLAGEATLTIDPNDSPSVYVFTNIATDGNGQIFLRTLNEEGGRDNAHINALELTAIPEPATIFLTLGGLLAVGLILRRRL